MPVDATASSPEPTLDEIGTSLQELEQLMADLRVRYDQVKADEPVRTQLQEQVQAKKQQFKATSNKAASNSELKAEIDQLSAQLDEVEMRLESSLVSWLGLREYFWQIARFGGLGILVGWGLATWMMNDRSVQERSPVRLEQRVK